MSSPSTSTSRTWFTGSPSVASSSRTRPNRSRGLVRLTPRRGAGEHGDLAGACDPYRCALIRAEAGALHHVADADAEVPAVRSRFRLAYTEPVIIGGLQRLGLARRVVAAVVNNRLPIPENNAHLVRHLLGLDEIAPPHLAGSRPSSSATRSINRSITKMPCGRPAPRTGEQAGLLVSTSITSISKSARRAGRARSSRRSRAARCRRANKPPAHGSTAPARPVFSRHS